MQPFPVPDGPGAVCAPSECLGVSLVSAAGLSRAEGQRESLRGMAALGFSALDPEQTAGQGGGSVWVSRGVSGLGSGRTWGSSAVLPPPVAPTLTQLPRGPRAPSGGPRAGFLPSFRLTFLATCVPNFLGVFKAAPS